MTRTIYKEIIQILDEQHIPLHREARILSAQIQNYLFANERDKVISVWYDFPTDRLHEPKDVYLFRIAGTGHEIKDGNLNQPLKFIDTVQVMDGELVFHVYARKL